MAKIYVFPGQGSQKRGMGGELFQEFAQQPAQANAILHDSIEELCGPDPREELNRTEFTQPALFVVSALSYLKRLQTASSPPDFVAGHSLGEYNALFAAGVFDFATGLKIVQRRGELMSQAAGGGMAAVIGINTDAVRQVIRTEGFDSIDLANLNTPLQTVISGPARDIRAAEHAFVSAGARYVILNVSGAFHSRYMSSIRSSFERVLHEFVFSPLRIPVIANRTARPYRSGEVREQLAGQITDPVRWVETVRYLCSFPDPQIEEIGPGMTLTNLVRQCREHF